MSQCILFGFLKCELTPTYHCFSPDMWLALLPNILKPLTEEKASPFILYGNFSLRLLSDMGNLSYSYLWNMKYSFSKLPTMWIIFWKVVNTGILGMSIIHFFPLAYYIYIYITPNSMAYGTRRFNAAFTRALQ